MQETALHVLRQLPAEALLLAQARVPATAAAGEPPGAAAAAAGAAAAGAAAPGVAAAAGGAGLLLVLVLAQEQLRAQGWAVVLQLVLVAAAVAPVA